MTMKMKKGTISVQLPDTNEPFSVLIGRRVENGKFEILSESVIKLAKHRRVFRLPPLNKLKCKVCKSIIGQDEAVSRIITAIYRTIRFKNMKSNVLIIGKTGSGKTETLKQICKELSIPYTIEDATKYTKEGYVGSSVEDMIYNLLDNADWDFEKAEKGMLIIDEIDKKVDKGDFSDVAGGDVLNSLLKIIEGTIIKVAVPEDIYEETGMLYYKFDTSNLIVFFSGVFPGLDGIREKRLKNRGVVGFKIDNDSDKYNDSYTKSDLVNFGLPEEFAGRLDTIIELRTLDKHDLLAILNKSNLSIFRRYQGNLGNLRIDLKYNPKVLEDIAEKALKSNTGARELNLYVNGIFEKAICEIFDNPSRKKRYLKLSDDIVNDNSKYTLSFEED